MATFEEWAGRALEFSIGADASLGSRVRLNRITATTTGLEMSLPDARKYHTGGPILVVWNVGANSFDVVGADGGAVRTVAQNELLVCYLIDNTSAAGDWRTILEATDGVPLPPVNDFFYTIGAGDAAEFKLPIKYDHLLNSWAAGTAGTYNHIDVPAVEFSNARAYIPDGNSPYTVEQYDPDVWTVEGNATRNHTEGSASRDGTLGEFYGGGQTAANMQKHERYTEATDSWASGTALTDRQRDGAAQRIETGTIMVMGGTTSHLATWTANQTNYAHDTSGDTFTSKTSLPSVARAAFGRFLLGGDVFIAGGTTSNTATVVHDRLDSYELSGDAWTSRQAFPDGGRYQGPAGAARTTGTAYGVGGSGAVDANSYQVDTWTAIADHPASGGQYRQGEDSSVTLTL